ncbi:MAG: response regulator [Anaerolineae bacterium]|nr:response regulator [Anaerolineae bacterium]
MNTLQVTRVLIAEDNALVSEMIQALLRKIGYTVVGEAVDGLQAVELTKELQPDVVLMDIAMPEVDGIEATQRIQEECPTPVVVLTAFETPELLERASKAGVGMYLVKPPNIRDLERAITIARARFADIVELRKLNEDLKAYAHTVAHDLKNPLTRIKGPAELLASDYEDMTTEQIKASIYHITAGVEKMTDIINDLLILAEVRNKDVELIPLDMEVIVTEALKRLSTNIEECGAEIILPKRWPLAMGHPVWVEQVWVNYLSNALKYGKRAVDPATGARQKPVIQLGYDRASLSQTGELNKPRMICFWITDNGPGIDEESIAQLFKPFIRLPNGQVKGHGLGLSIVKRIVQKLGGQVSVESQMGQGSTFKFTLPTGPKL